MAAAGSSLLDVTLELVGIAPVVRGIREAASGMEEFGRFTERANDAIDELRRSQMFSGGPAAQVGALASAFESAGIRAEELATIAHELRERLFRDPQAIGAFGRSIVPARLGGPQNEAAALEQAIRILRETTDAEERLYKARRLGIEVLLPLADLDERQFRALQREGAIRGAMVDDELRQLRATETAQQARLKALQDEQDMERERSRLRLRNLFRERIQLPWEEFWARMLPGAARAAQTQAQAGANAHTRAVEANTEALRLLRGEFANGGPRARAAVPAGLRGTALQNALEAHGFALGAFSVSMGSQ